MILEREQWHLGYAQLLRDCRGVDFGNGDGGHGALDDVSLASGRSGGSGFGLTGMTVGGVSGLGGANMGSIGTVGRVLILVAADADAMASARILSYMLRADGVPYQLRPCTGFWRMKRLLKKIGVIGVDDEDNENDGISGENDNGGNDVNRVEDHAANAGTEDDVGDVRAVVLINMGANRNLARLFVAPSNSNSMGNMVSNGFSQESIPSNPSNRSTRSVRCYVFDCHRPYHLSNIYSGKNVVIFNDRPFAEGEIPSDGDNLSGDESSSSSESDDEDSDDESGDEDGGDEQGNEGGDGGGRRREDLDEGEEEFDDGDVTGILHSPRRERDQDRDHDGDESEVEGSDIEDDDDSGMKPTKRQKTSRTDQDDEDDGLGKQKKQKQRGSEDAENPLNVTAATAATADMTQEDTQSQHSQDQDDSQSQSSQMFPSLQSNTPPLTDDVNPTDQMNQTQTTLNIRQLHKARRDRIRLHYSSGSYHASPSSWTTYTLSSQLRFGNTPDLLWLACVGVTDAYLHGRLDVSGYGALCMDLKRHVGRLFEEGVVERVGRAVYAEDLEDDVGDEYNEYGHGEHSSRNGGPMTQIGLSENGRILIQSEYRFLLLRHTSLWDAMFHSNYVASKMQLYKSSGKQKLMELLAKMGFPLEECRQPFVFVGAGLRRRLREMIDEYVPEYGMENVSYTGFVRVTGYKSLLSASDMSYAITALLECSSSLSNESNTNSNDASTNLSEEDKEDQEMIHAFNIAYDALSSNGSSLSSLALTSQTTGGVGGGEGSDLTNLVNGGAITNTTGLGAGIRLAMTLQRTIMATARNLMERNAITRLSHFRYAYLNCTGSGMSGDSYGSSRVVTPDHSRSNGGNGSGSSSRPQFHIFAKPLVLTKLAHFLMDVNRENGKWTGNKARPLVLLAEKPRATSSIPATNTASSNAPNNTATNASTPYTHYHSTYMVIGYEYPEHSGSVVKNKFGQNFELAAKTMRGTFWFDSFDSNVVEVEGRDVQRFVEQLHYMMESV